MTAPSEIGLVLQMPDAIYALWRAQQAVVRHYSSKGLKFTLDGRLVGDIAEALALDHFDLVLPKRRTGGVDALTRAGKTVQVKSTGKSTMGPAFTPGAGAAEHLLFFRIDFAANTALVGYNGPEAPIRALLPNGQWKGTKRILLEDVRRLAGEVAKRDSLPLKQTASGAGK